jgi:hypothetical protein
MMKTMRVALGLLALCSVLAVRVAAHAPSGAIFTTVEDGSEVNFNHYPSKEAVYLDGGPGPGAPQHAAGLDDGRYVFQVTDPSGKTLLSTDQARCRQFDVAAGIITNVVVTGCEHATGLDVDHGATTVQLVPYNDTPNNGGVYKVWVTFLQDFLDGCAELGVANGLNVVDCGPKTGGNAHGFVPSHSKTDNFKVKETKVREIDTRFFNDQNGNGWRDNNEPWIDGLQITWTDTLGGSNRKSSYYNAALNVNHEAHVEAVEDGTHQITIDHQPGCTVGGVFIDGEWAPQDGPQTVNVVISKRDREITVFIDVGCTVQ